jgi:hypothetical protein
MQQSRNILITVPALWNLLYMNHKKAQKKIIKYEGILTKKEI